MQRYDLIAFSLIAFVAVVAAAVSLDPKGFSIQAWQPLMASIITLGGAGIVYRGATLAYRAAMAKVDLDREINRKSNRRRERGLYVRTRFALLVMYHDARHFGKTIQDPTKPHTSTIVELSSLTFRTRDSFGEAWQQMDAFPTHIVDLLFRIQTQLLNVDDALVRLGDELKLEWMPIRTPEGLADLREALNEIDKYAVSSFAAIGNVLETMPED